MISPTAAKNALRQSAIRFLACIAALSITGLALVITHPAWWPVSVVTAASIPLLYQLTGMSRYRGGAGGRFGPMERLARSGYSIWNGVPITDRTIPHIVVGPTGVFAVSRTNWSGTFASDAEGSLRHSRRDAGRLVWEACKDAASVKSRLREVGLRRVPVRAVIAAARARTPQAALDGVQATVVRMGDLASFILSAPPSLSPEQVARAISAFEGEERTERSRPGRG